ncbi:MAG: DMT family transporter [Archangium sp.]|nr:DMT family transporter [Archangium sp.]
MSNGAPANAGTLRPSAALLAATAVWGATFVTVKDALEATDAFTFLAIRFAVGALASVALSKLFKEPRANVTRAALVLGLLLFGGYLLQTLGLERTTPARSAFVTGLTVIFVPFVAWRLERKRPPLRSFVAPFVALFGLQQLTSFRFDAELPAGDLFTLGCAFLYAFHIVLMGRYAKGFSPVAPPAQQGFSPVAPPAQQGLPVMRLTAGQLLVVAVLSTSCLPFIERRFASTPTVWFSIVFTGVVASALAIGAQAWAQRQLTSVRAAVIYSTEPVFAVLTVAALGHGLPGGPELRGGALILLAVLISEVPLGEILGRKAPSS